MNHANLLRGGGVGMRYHALEITLTRPVTRAELARATQVMALAPNHDRTRLITLAQGKKTAKALNHVRRRLSGLLPLDVVATHYPDADNRITLTVAFTPPADAAIRRAAQRAGQQPGVFVEQALRETLARQARRDAEQLSHALQTLLKRTTPQQFAAALGRALTNTLELPRAASD